MEERGGKKNFNSDWFLQKKCLKVRDEKETCKHGSHGRESGLYWSLFGCGTILQLIGWNNKFFVFCLLGVLFIGYIGTIFVWV